MAGLRHRNAEEEEAAAAIQAGDNPAIVNHKPCDRMPETARD